MQVYNSKSLEELRYEDYTANRKGPLAALKKFIIESGPTFSVPGNNSFGDSGVFTSESTLLKNMPKISQTCSSSKSSPNSDSTFTCVLNQNQEKGGEKLLNLKGLNNMNQTKFTNSVGLNSSSFLTGEQQVNSSSFSPNNSVLPTSSFPNKLTVFPIENNSSFTQQATDYKKEISPHSTFSLTGSSPSYCDTIASNLSYISRFSFGKDPVNSTASSNPNDSTSPAGENDSKNVSFNSSVAHSSTDTTTFTPSEAPFSSLRPIRHTTPSIDTTTFTPAEAPFSSIRPMRHSTPSLQAPFGTFNIQKISDKPLNTTHHPPAFLFGESRDIRNNVIVLNPSNNKHHSLSKQHSGSSSRQRSNCLPTYTIDLSWTESVEIDDSAINRKVKKLEYIVGNHFVTNYEIAWLLKAVTCIDLTTLNGDDTMTNVHRLCYKAAHPISEHLIKCFEEGNLFENIRKITTAAVCVYPARVICAVNNMIKFRMTDEIPVASVATGFPSGQYPLDTRLKEIELSVANGAKEIDVVINRNLVISNRWSELYDEIIQMKIACGKACMKTILATGECGSLNNIYKASMIAMMAGSDFIKTSTGKEAVNATLQVGVVMCRAITDYYEKFNRKVGIKPAGGIKTVNDALAWLVLVKELLGREWLNSHLFRIGASSLLGDIENRLFYLLKGYLPSKEYFLIS
ncbi:deoxyribose-phosphate aldolase isoform X2 [Lycorma delicatula]